jgi:UDP-N-acetylglucosamine--N-acetylmuramyl-(pentapeptide) pyrophosphoryl-undecaprenol N-acetylglucosamine transferase
MQRKTSQSIVMTGGGTGGHLAVVRAVKEELKNDAMPMIYIGATRGQDKAWFENDEDFAARYFLEMEGVVNKRGLAKLAALGKLVSSVLKARRLLRKHRAGVVFSVGGYSAAPTAIAALTLRIPLVIHEQNAAVGTLNRLLRSYAAAFLSSYDEKSPLKAYPVKRIFFEKARTRDKVEKILFLGGSQGAKAINDLALALAPELAARGIEIVHQAGEKHRDDVKKAYDKLGIDAEVFGFTSEMPALMADADLAVARAGASTLWELTANRLPAVFVPYPYAAGDHQYHNARFIVEHEAGWLMREEALDRAEILRIIERSVKAQSQKLGTLIEPDGAKKIAELLVETLRR